MTQSLRWQSALLFILVFGIVSGSYAQDSDTQAPLTKQKVKDWIQTRIATNKLQSTMKANAAGYDNVVHAFFEKREALLKSRGWSVDDFEATEKRIGRVRSAMDQADELEETKEDHEKEVAEIKANQYYTEQQKEQMIEMKQKLQDRKKQFIQQTKPDWPAVRPYRGTLKKLTDWVAGNIPNPPEVN